MGTFLLTRDTTEVRELLCEHFATPTSALSLHAHMPLAQVEEVLAGRRHVTALQAAMLARVAGWAGLAEALLVAQARAEALAACALLMPPPRERRESQDSPDGRGVPAVAGQGLAQTGERRSHR